MATNLAKNKIVFGDTPVIDLTSDTATASDIANGVRFHLADGTVGMGTAHFGTGATVSGNNISMPGTVNGWTPHNWVTCTDAELNDDIAFASRYGIKPYLYFVWSAQPGVAWGTATDAQIDRALSLYYQDLLDLWGMWNVGDERVVHLSAMAAMSPFTDTHVEQDVTYVLSNKGGKTLETPINGHTTCAFQVDQKDCLTETGYMRPTRTAEGGWKDNERRTWCNTVYKNAVPQAFRNHFKPYINQTSHGPTAWSTIDNTVDTFALRSEVEVAGTTSHSKPGEGSQVAYYPDQASRVKYVGRREVSTRSVAIWWLRSPAYDGGYARLREEGVIYAYDSNNYLSFAPFGVI